MAEWPHSMSLEATYTTPKEASIIAASLGQEVGEIDDDRSETTLSVDAATITIDIVAGDLIALRAAINTWSGLLRTAEATHDIAS